MQIIFIQSAHSKHLFEKFMLYTYIRENDFRAFSSHGNIFYSEKCDLW